MARVTKEPKKNKLAIFNNAPELALIEESKATLIRNTFLPMANQLQEFEDQCNEIFARSEDGITDSLTKDAKKLRIAVGKIRIEADKKRLKENEGSQREIKARNAVCHILKWAVTEKEDKLKEIEEYHARQEQARLAALQEERVALLSEYVEDAEDRDLSGMEEDVWLAYLAAKKKDYEDVIKAEEEAERLRVEEEKKNRKEREQLEKENKRLQKLAKEQEKKEEEEREKRELAEKKLKEKEEEEQRKSEAEEAKIEAELSKRDEDKVEDLIDDLEALKTKYSFKSATNKKMYKNVGKLLEKIILYIDEE